MIYDRLCCADSYKKLGDAFSRALAYLTETDFSVLKDGRYEIEGDDVFATVSTYRTKEPSEVKPESHREYADIQSLIEGTETVGIAPLEECQAPFEQHPERDLYFHPVPAVLETLTLRPGSFMIFFPQDVHLPCMNCGGPKTVRKVVVKVRLKGSAE